ncbi:MAG: hypothetical protein R3178_02045, partial [Rhodothermales bacterium]|nr:hypothetical protein [Rhodothermales bacterium]
ILFLPSSPYLRATWESRLRAVLNPGAGNPDLAHVRPDPAERSTRSLSTIIIPVYYGAGA